MRKTIVRGVVTAVVSVSLAVGLMIALEPDTSRAGKGNRCEQQCYQEYEQCVVFCSKNPCFADCETVLDICLSNCGSQS